GDGEAIDEGLEDFGRGRGTVAGAVAGLLHGLEQQERPEHGVIEQHLSAAGVDVVEQLPDTTAWAAGLAVIVVKESRELRQEDVQHAGLPGEVDRPTSPPAAQQTQNLLRDPRPRRERERAPAVDNGVVELGRHSELQPAGELDRTQDPDRILAEARLG